MPPALFRRLNIQCPNATKVQTFCHSLLQFVLTCCSGLGGGGGSPCIWGNGDLCVLVLSYLLYSNVLFVREICMFWYRLQLSGWIIGSLTYALKVLLSTKRGSRGTWKTKIALLELLAIQYSSTVEGAFKLYGTPSRRMRCFLPTLRRVLG